MLWTQISPQCSLTSYYNSTPSWNILNFLVWFLFLFVTDYVNWNLRLKMTLFEKVWISRLAEIFFLQQVRELYNLYSSVFLNPENHNKFAKSLFPLIWSLIIYPKYSFFTRKNKGISCTGSVFLWKLSSLRRE